MRRVVKDLSEILQRDTKDEAAASVDAFADGSQRSKSNSSITKAAMAAKVGMMRAAMKRPEGIEKVSPSELVALYYICHTDTYGSEPIELRGQEWGKACIAAGNLIKREFNDNSAEAVLFVKWTWRREMIREQRDQGKYERSRIAWRKQFLWKDLLSDYRTEMTRRMKSRKIYE